MFKFNTQKNNAGGVIHTVYRNGKEIGHISNLHSFRLFPTNGTKYEITMMDSSNPLHGRRFRTLRAAKNEIKTIYVNT